MADNKYRFYPADVPTLEDMKLYADDNLNRISNAFELVEQTNIPFFGSEPSRFIDGMMVRADGTGAGWSPDDGIGLYVYWGENGTSYDNTWQKVI